MVVYMRFIGNDCHYKCVRLMRTNPYDEELVRSYDDMLHKALSKIFRERNLTSDQIKELLREQTSSDQDTIFKLLVEVEPGLSKIFPEIKPSLLWIATLCNYQKSAELLVSSGADVNEIQSNFFPDRKPSILQMVVNMYPSEWNDRFIALLIEHGADFNAQDTIGTTPLYNAVSQFRVEATKLLLEKGADVNAADSKGWTPLLEAVAYTNETDKLLPLLMKHGADVTVRNKDGENVLHILPCAEVELTDLARIFIEKGVSVNDANQDGLRPIHRAVSNRKLELVKLFLDSGADVNAQDEDGESPLYKAASYKDTAMLLTLLLKRGANIDLKTKEGSTALHSAYSDSRMENVEILLAVGADLYKVDNDEETPLHRFLYPPSTKQALKKLALKKVRPSRWNQWREKRIIMRSYPELWSHYQDCIEHVDRMKVTKFTETCTFFELLTECQCRIADFMHQDRQFENKFRQFDLSVFPTYAEDIVEAFERAKRLYRSVMEQEDVINEAFDNGLPDKVVKKVAGYIFHCEMCELKRIVQASRRKDYFYSRLLSRLQCTCLNIG